MFDELVESKPHRDRSTVQTAASIAAHTLIIAASIQLTRAAAETVVAPPPRTEMLFVRPEQPRAVLHERAIPGSLAPPAPLAQLPVAPVIVQTALPSIVITRGFDATRLDVTGRPGIPGNDAAPDTIRLATVQQVDVAVEYVDGPPPKYPPALRHAGIEGSVALRYIVGADGKVEKGSVTAQRSSHRAFETPAIDAIELSRFRAGRLNGRPVRQLVEQIVRFTLH